MNRVIKYIFAIAILFTFSILYTACNDDEQKSYMELSAPVITTVSPQQGYPGNEITITGANFGQDRTEVIGRIFFNGVEATGIMSYTDTQIVVEVPAEAGVGPISVWVWNNSTTTDLDFNFMAGAKANSLTPEKANPGESITVTGENFPEIASDQIFVTFAGDVTGAVTSATTEEIVVIVPEGAESGVITITFTGYQTITAPVFTLSGETKEVRIEIDYSYMVEETGKTNMKDDPFAIWDWNPGDYIIFKVELEEADAYTVYCNTATTKDGASLHIVVGSDLDEVREATTTIGYVQNIVNNGSWGDWGNLIRFEPYDLEEGIAYIKVTILSEGTDNQPAAIKNIVITNK